MEYIVSETSTGKFISLVGPINEDSDIPFQHLGKELEESPKVVFDFSKVQSINSLGVRAWVRFLRQLEKKEEIIFSKCTPDVIMQINMIPSFLGHGKVESFFVNYTCDTCQKDKQELLWTKDIPTNTIPLAPKCSTIHCNMQTEELEDEYFVFLTRSR